MKHVSNRIWEETLTHTVTHTGKRADKNNGEDGTYLPQYTEQKASKSPENRQMECPDTLRNQQVMCLSHTTSSKKASKAEAFDAFFTAKMCACEKVYADTHDNNKIYERDDGSNKQVSA